LIIVGAEDRIVPGKGGELRVGEETGRRLGQRRPAADKPVIPARAAADYWAKANGCRASNGSATPAYTLTAWTRCKDGAEVQFYTVANNGHAWPGGREGREGANLPARGFNASQVIWDFFKQHRL